MPMVMMRCERRFASPTWSEACKGGTVRRHASDHARFPMCCVPGVHMSEERETTHVSDTHTWPF